MEILKVIHSLQIIYGFKGIISLQIKNNITVWRSGDRKLKKKCLYVHALSTKVQNRSFHVIEWKVRTGCEMYKIEKGRAKHAALLFFKMTFANLELFLSSLVLKCP